jgi:hypothetical protein
MDDLAQALALAGELGFLILRAEVLMQAGAVMELRGDREAASAYWRQALELAEQKENKVMSGMLREHMARAGSP